MRSQFSLKSSKTLQNRTPYWKQCGKILWVALGLHTVTREKRAIYEPEKGPDARHSRALWARNVSGLLLSYFPAIPKTYDLSGHLERCWCDLGGRRDCKSRPGTFRRSYRAPPPSQTCPSGTHPPNPSARTCFRPDFDLIRTWKGCFFRSKSGVKIRVQIRSKSGPGGGVQLGRCRSGVGPCSSSESPQCTITHKKITELIPKQFRFGNSSTQITEYNSQNNSVRDPEILCSHFLPRPSNSRNNSVR